MFLIVTLSIRSNVSCHPKPETWTLHTSPASIHLSFCPVKQKIRFAYCHPPSTWWYDYFPLLDHSVQGATPLPRPHNGPWESQVWVVKGGVSEH